MMIEWIGKSLAVVAIGVACLVCLWIAVDLLPDSDQEAPDD